MIIEPRDIIEKYFQDFPYAVFRYFPDDLAQLPCVVIEQPRISITNKMAETRLIIDSIGRKISDLDAQNELDEMTEKAISNLRTRPNARAERQFDLVNVNPGIVRVAGKEYPAYAIEVQFDKYVC
jgi:hypothetical protein